MRLRPALALFPLLLGFGCGSPEGNPASTYACAPLSADDSESNVRADEYQDLVDSIVAQGLPGLMFSINEPDQPVWDGAAGFADLASGVPLEPCQILRVGSTVKTFTATTVLLLAEEEKLDLDDPISDYLSAAQLRGLENAEGATVRQLLQHSSGIYNYIVNPRFQTKSLNDLDKVWEPEELLSYARGHDSAFPLGTDVSYSNTNYVLLGDLITKIEGRPFWEVFEDLLFGPLGLDSTQFAATDPVPDNIVQGYVDLYSKNQVINSTQFSGWDYYTADGGLISNAHDLNRFLRALLEGEILNEASLREMLSFREPKDFDSAGFPTAYGLGIFKIETDHGPAYMHSGDAIGYFATMIHFPEQGVTLSWATNGNYGKLDDYAQGMRAMERVFNAVLK